MKLMGRTQSKSAPPHGKVVDPVQPPQIKGQHTPGMRQHSMTNKGVLAVAL
jgi:hypothetical protein